MIEEVVLNVFIHLVVDLLFRFHSIEVICTHKEADVRKTLKNTLTQVKKRVSTYQL